MTRKQYRLPFPSTTLIVGLLLQACTSAPQAPPPVQDASDVAPIERTSPQEPSARNTDAATTTLLAQAHDAMAENDQTHAIVYLERAIRINPRDAELWILLSSAHLRDENVTAAEQHARQSGQTRRARLTLLWRARARVDEQCTLLVGHRRTCTATRRCRCR